jgi:DNA polymerase elongation subunit (family B)
MIVETTTRTVCRIERDGDVQTIVIYAQKEDSTYVAVVVDDFTPSLEVLLPEGMEDGGRFFRELRLHLIRRDRDDNIQCDHAPKSYEIKTGHRSNGARMQKDLYCVLRFRNKEHIRHCCNVLSKPIIFKQQFSTTEHHSMEVDEMLYLELGIGPVDKFSFEDRQNIPLDHGSRKTTMPEEYHVSWQELKRVDPQPVFNTIKRIMFLDMECYSLRGIFPNPLFEEDAPYAIVAYVVVGDKQKGFLLTAIPNLPANFLVPGLEHLQQIHCSDPSGMTHTLCDIIKTWSIAILTGHNIIGFDLPYLYKYLACQGLPPPGVSRLTDPPPPRMKQLLSKTMGYVHIWDMSSIIVIDSMLYAQRVFTMMPLYKLSYLAEVELPKGDKTQKMDVTKDEIFEAYRGMRDATPETLQTALELMNRVLLYCEVDVLVVMELFNKWRVLDNLSKLAEHSSSLPEDAQLGLQTPQWVSRLSYRLRERGYYVKSHSYDDPSMVADDLEGGLVGTVHTADPENSEDDDESDEEHATEPGDADSDEEGDDDTTLHDIPNPRTEPNGKRNSVGGTASGSPVVRLTRKQLSQLRRIQAKMGITSAAGFFSLVAVLDFASMYPSIIQGYNACITTVNHGPIGSLDVKTEVYEYTQTLKRKVRIEVEEPIVKKARIGAPPPPRQLDIVAMFGGKRETIPEPTRKRIKTIVTEEQREYVREFVHPSVREGIMPSEMTALRDFRTAVRAQAKQLIKEAAALKKDSPELVDTIRELERRATNLDYEQLFVKQSTNALYGFIAGKSVLADRGISQFITGMARKLITFCRDYLCERGYNVVYGDSVTGDTPVWIRLTSTGEVRLCCIEDIEGVWRPYGTQKEELVLVQPLEIWDENGFTKVVRFIRHLCQKPLVRIRTRTGIVDCTTDHSLVDAAGGKLAPADIEPDRTELLHTSTLPDFSHDLHPMNMADAFECGTLLTITTTQSSGGESRVPYGMFTASRDNVLAFFDGYARGRHLRRTPLRLSKEALAGLWFLADRHDLAPEITETPAGHLDIKLHTDTQRKLTQVVGAPRYLPGKGARFVYDFETVSHHFHVGPGRLVVHNTDSVFAVIPPDVKDPYAWGDQMAAELTSNFPHPIEMEMEGANMLFLVGSKCYVLVPLMRDGTYNYDKIKVKGLMTARRDHAKFIGKFFNDTIFLALHRTPLTEVLELVLDRMGKIYRHEVSAADLAVTKKYKASSQNGNLQTFCRALRSRGVLIQNADHVTYVIADAAVGTPVAERMRLREEFERQDTEKLDMLYYMESTHRVDGIINTGYASYIRNFPDYKVLPRGGICEAITQCVAAGTSWDAIAKEIREIGIYATKRDAAVAGEK